jgi:5-methylcytosine-specific restriction endonuclease McrA
VTRMNCRKKPGPTARARAAKARKRLRAYKLACVQVDQAHGENGYVECAMCGKWVMGIHHDHIRPRSVAPELRTDKTNLQPLCADCHLAKHAKQDWMKGRLTRVTDRIERE